METSLSATAITRCSAWDHLGNIHNYVGLPPELQGLNTDQSILELKISIEEKKGVDIEKYVENKYT
jgi:hypothetical protein